MRVIGSLVGVAATLAQVACGGGPESTNAVAPPAQRQVVDVGSAPFRGPANAAVTLVEFGDFECPYCGEEEPVIKQLSSAFPTQLRVVFKEFPLPMHTYAEGAAEAALAAYNQGKFWPYHDSLYAHQNALTEADLVAYATALALDATTFQSELQQGTYEPAVQADVTQGKSLGVRGTPTFFVNGRAAVGALPYDTLSAAVEEELDAGN